MGARVTLVDAYGAGDLRAASSGETRVIRASYGPKPIYAEWAWRALKLWKQAEREWKTPLFVNSGVLWLCGEEDEYARASLATLERLRVPHERLDPAAVARRFPQFSGQGVRFAWYEPQAGFLRARVATQAVAAAVQREGGRVVTGAVEPPAGGGSQLPAVRLAHGGALAAETFVFACGAWLPRLFPAELARRIVVTRQEVFFFGPPAGEKQFTAERMPVWLDPGEHYYGIPSAEGRGLKVADDSSGPVFDPSTGDRAVSAEGLRNARAYLGRRLPALADAPLVETRVCQYARTPDAHLVIDRHPHLENVWLAGGGSGHGFKLGPALGEFVARHVLRRKAPPILPQMRLGAGAWPAGTARPATSSL